MQNQKEQFVESLIDLGLKEYEAKVYLACLELGQATVGRIGEQASVQRTFVYDILNELEERGIVSVVEIRNVKNYSAISADRLKEMQMEKFKKFQAIIPDLKAFEKTAGDRPRVRFFEGKEGIKSALSDTLDQPVGSQILAYATGVGIYEDMPEFMSNYLKKRVKKKIGYKGLVPDNELNRQHVLQNNELLRDTILLPEDKFPFTNEIDIYGNKVAIMSLQGEILAVIIESESIAKTQRSIFELAWLGAKNLERIKN
jgi:sugar-specific transcriptional regulator TrmB